MSAGQGYVDASPEKRFFVEMLTRDIELAPAIIDLVDNSIDGAKRLRPDEAPDRFAGLSIAMRIDAERFEILDTCGGFSRAQAATYAFKFGRNRDQERTPGEVGQFGVGMKRAIFKIGREFLVSSTFDGDRWSVEVDVDAWLEDEEWRFPIDGNHQREPASPGTLLRCSRLLPSTSARFAQPAFVSRVLSEISMRHAIALQQGLNIQVNGRSLVPRAPALLVSSALEPISYGETLTDSLTGMDVRMELHAGLDAIDDGDEETDTDDPTLFTGSDAAGWYVFCNGRALLFADRGRLTGWGEEVPRFHPQYRWFRGFVYLSGDSAAMPWNTAKTTVDEDSEIWAKTRHHIVDALRKSITVMNRIKREVQQRPRDDRPLVSAVAGSKAVPLAKLPERKAYKVPDPAPRVVSDAKKISYTVSSAAFSQAAEAMETDRASEIGQRTFAYWMRREVDRDYDG